MPNPFVDEATNFVLMKQHRYGSRLSTDEIFSKSEARERARLAQIEEDANYEGRPEFKWTYFVAELTPVEE